MPEIREGSLEAPTRRPLGWTEPAFWDEAALDAELRRVFEICHGCRRCFNLCDSFPRLFDLIDNSPSEELAEVPSSAFPAVVDACTLCDMCFMTKCPYVPPHQFDLDIPHLMLRYRAVQARRDGVPFADRALTETDRNGRLGVAASTLANWATRRGNALTRPALEAALGVHREAELPRFPALAFTVHAAQEPPALNREAPAFGRKAVLYATCYVNYQNPGIGMAARAVLAHNGVETEAVHPGCCGMPQLEQGRIDVVAEKARRIAPALLAWADRGHDIVALTPSCALMLKFEWPLILPDDADVRRLAGLTRDITQYVVELAKSPGLAPGLGPLAGGVSVHLACHARAQNMGPKAAELMRLIPETPVSVIERCSGHGGSFGVKTAFFEVAHKVGKPAARQIERNARTYFASECPLAALHLAQGVERLRAEGDSAARTAAPAVEPLHPIELFARAYGLI